MQVMSSDPNYAEVPDFVNLTHIQQSLINHLSQMRVEEIKAGKNLDYLNKYLN